MQLKKPNLGILQKILLSFLIISLLPLLFLGYAGTENLTRTGMQVLQQVEQMGARNLKQTDELGKISVEDSVKALDKKATEAIEMRTVELAQRIADFLYERDKDLIVLSHLQPSADLYLKIYQAARRDVISTAHTNFRGVKLSALKSSNPENDHSWRHMKPLDFKKISRPLYREITFIDLQGQEIIKIRDGLVSKELRDISRREHTYCQAETYFRQLSGLKPGEIYVSNVIGAHVPGWLYKDDKGKIAVKTGSAYAGKENPTGRKFEGIIRWATPVFNSQGAKTGYVTMALDHIHVMEFTDHVIPTEERFTVLSDGGSGNYAWMWDYRGKSISHPRDFFIIGYDPTTGLEVPGWLSQETYNAYKRSGMTLEEFTRQLPSFRNFSQKKAPSAEQIRSGNISLDCRILDTAPQCEGWHKGTEDGGSGSFLILWSGLWKLTTYAAIPYHTGQYGNSKRGFGYVTLGANVDEFHRDANITKAKIERRLADDAGEINRQNSQTLGLIKEQAARNRLQMIMITLLSVAGVIAISIMLSLSITKPLRRLTDGALAMSRGQLEQSIEVTSGDEIGQLAATFNEMARSIAELDKMKSDFVTIASHELRTPIQAMLLSVSGILEGYSGNIDDEVREDLQIAKQGIERLMRLVESLLNLSRIESRKTELSFEPVQPAEMVNLAIAEVNDLAFSHNHRLTMHVPEGLPTINVDRDSIIQVLINLLSNAIKYNPDGGCINLGVELSAGQIRFQIADNGYGVPENAREDIFKKFFQADSLMSQKVGGTGLGLTICKGIVEMHHGMIVCDSPLPSGLFPDWPLGDERRGAVFTVTFPLKGSSIAESKESDRG